MDNEWLSLLSSRQIHNLIKIAITESCKERLREELARRGKERRAWFLHEQRGRDRARAEQRLRK